MSRLGAQLRSDTKELIRDPVAVIFTLIMPFVVVALLAPIFVSSNLATAAEVGVVAGLDDPVAAIVVERLEASSALDVEHFNDRSAAELAVRHRDIAAAVVVPSGMDGTGSDGPGTGAADEVELVGSPQVAVPTGIRAAVENATAEAAAILVAAHAHEPTDPLGAGLVEATAAAAPAFAGNGTQGDRSERHNANVATATLRVIVLFMFLNVTVKSAQVARYRELGVMARLRTTGTRPATLAAAFAFSNVAYTVVQGLLLMAGATVFIGVTWPQPWVVTGLVLLAAVAAASSGTLVGFLLPSSRYGSTVAAPLVFVAAMMGGALWPLDIVGPELRMLGHLTPHAWAIDALNAAVFRWPRDEWMVPAGVLALCSAVFLTLTVLQARRTCASPA